MKKRKAKKLGRKPLDVTGRTRHRLARHAAASDFSGPMAGAIRSGRVFLIGAGPGDPELLTLKAVRILKTADVILLDDLVESAILQFVAPETKIISAGKTGHGPSCKQSDINALMVSLACSGNTVVRLKGGDPMIFGRAGEEIDACRAAGIPIESVPGISAAQAAASSLCVPLTERGKSRRIQFITGHGADGRLPDDLDIKAIADPVTTTAVYMPLKTLGELVAAAVADGIDPATPAVAVSRASRPGETVIASTLAELPFRLELEKIPGPMITLIGQVFAGCTSTWAGDPEIAALLAGQYPRANSDREPGRIL